MIRSLTLTLAIGFVAAGDALMACAVCGPQYNAKQAWAYLTMSMVFTAIPVAFGIGIFIYLRRRSRRTNQTP